MPKQTAVAVFMASAVLLFGGRNANAAAPPASINCTTGQTPNMTIVIHNNSTDHTIYPVLFAGAPSATDSWMQACFQLTDAQLTANPYPRASEYRMYINCCAPGENGIPPMESVTVNLPLYSPLVDSINPKNAGELIDWWQGGGINFFRDSDEKTSPPKVLQAHWKADQASNTIAQISNPPGCDSCTLHFFTAPASIPNYEPQQLMEYSLGAAPVNPQHGTAGQPAYLWVPNNVDYDISYVNYVYMPAVIEPYGNPLIGYVGSPGRISDFKTAIDNWSVSTLAAGWPLYNDQKGNVVPDKIPSALDIFTNVAGFDNTDNYIPAPSTTAPIKKMANQWDACVNHDGGDPICTQIRSVAALIAANYKNYKAVGDADGDEWKNVWACKGAPVAQTDELLLAHLYAWTPFLEGCTNTQANQLYNTPGYTDPKATPNYAAVKTEFDQLQYSVDVLNGKYGDFDPYVALIHGPTYLNAPYTYAYSVDDAVGNMQTDGTGMIIGVGGPQNLPNPDHATANINFNFGYFTDWPPNLGGYITFTEYGRCTNIPDTPTVSYFASFPVPLGVENSKSSVVNCTNSMLDSKGRVYLFKLKGWPVESAGPPPYAGFPTVLNPTEQEREDANNEFIDCTGDTGQVLNWCKTLYPYQAIDPNDPRATVNYYVILQGPAATN